ncbi:retroviral-like aspartic protease family protein [Glacieibacterium frigidum]|uniref:Peptidase A2 domain-containing protein n=1 Tax=Glacieibacterium frigidum TaxID=2593303 RepID=A0A552UG25_9SPHN|nr:retroviral-like aspartic protease family protein [Glacieibacterium frigidum]TRW17141.1 hypothetical protein FMM06_02770 [Glacieibacterium frigidum]
MISLAVAAAAALLATPPVVAPIPPATLDDSLEVTGEGLAARQIRSRMLVSVGIDGKGPYRFLVDSGADRTVVGSGLARDLGLAPAGSAVLQSVAGSSRVDTVTVGTLTLGRSSIDGIVAPALAEADLGAQGIVGIDALADQRLMFDFDARTVTVQDTRVRTRFDPDEIIVTARRRKGQLILTQASAGSVPIAAIVDTGAELTMGNMALRARVFAGRSAPVATPITLVSVTGASIEASLVTLPQIRLGGVILQDVQVAFVDAPPFALFGLDRKPAILLGTDLLQAFRRVSLDFRHRKIRFVLRR